MPSWPQACAAPWRLPADEIIMIGELVAVVDEQVGLEELRHAQADHRLGVLAQLAHQRREIGVAAEDDEGVDVVLGVAEVERIPRPCGCRPSSCRTGARAGLRSARTSVLVQRALEVPCIAIPIAVGLLATTMCPSVSRRCMTDLRMSKRRVVRIARTDDDVLEIKEHRHGGTVRRRA